MKDDIQAIFRRQQGEIGTDECLPVILGFQLFELPVNSGVVMLLNV